PINDNVGGSGTAFHARGSIITDQLDASGSSSFVWIRVPDYSKSNSAWGIENAVLAIVDVINGSFGGPCNAWCRSFAIFSGLSDERSALEFAKEFDTPAIFSAGNDQTNLDDEGEFFTPCELGNDLTVCVGSVTRSGSRSTFSNFGSNVDVFAPGNSLTIGATP